MDPPRHRRQKLLTYLPFIVCESFVYVGFAARLPWSPMVLLGFIVEALDR